jgi:2-polyprenyl-3-methyl-5-hydroxy-6-metoxy-1,4-benzoquinol methylase
MDRTYTLIENILGFYEVHPKPSGEYLSDYYNDKYYGTNKVNNQYNYEYTPDEIIHKQIDSLEALKYLKKEPGKLMEIGFGEGFFLDRFHSLGWQINGVDFTSDGLVKYHPHLQAKVLVGDVFEAIESSIKSQEKYDLVVCNHVLEHVIDPITLLNRIHQLLNHDGVARIAVPNDGSWLQKEVVNRGFADDNYWVHPPDHLNYFTVDSLSRVIEETGFEIIDILGTFPIDCFLLNPDTNYQQKSALGRNCHFARVAFEVSLLNQSIENLTEFRRGCAKAGVGRDLIVYCRPSTGASMS